LSLGKKKKRRGERGEGKRRCQDGNPFRGKKGNAENRRCHKQKESCQPSSITIRRKRRGRNARTPTVDAPLRGHTGCGLV